MTYEEAIKKLEELVAKLEEGNMPLEESIEAFEQGMELCAFCNKIINDCTRRITCINEQKAEEQFLEGTDDL